MKTFWPEELDYFEDRVLIGAGQYGLVYKTYNTILKKTTVVKLVEVMRLTNASLLKRFEREILSLKKIKHPHVVKIFDYWVEAQFVAFEMEYVPGISLEDFLKISRATPYETNAGIIQEIILQILSGLSGIHANFLVHRDLKPSNVLIQNENIDKTMPANFILDQLSNKNFQAKLTDLGLVKDLTASISITRTSDFIGTAAYVSPEQAKGEKITFQSDLYALGLIWYQLICGKNPFHKKSIYDTIQAHVRETAPPIEQTIPDFPSDLSHVISTLLKKKSENRVYSAKRLHQILIRKTHQNIPLMVFDITDNAFPGDSDSPGTEAVKSLLDAIQTDESQAVHFVALRNNTNRLEFLRQTSEMENQDTLAIRFLPSESPDFIVSFSRRIFSQIPQLAIDQTKKQTRANGLQDLILRLIFEEDFYLRMDIVRDHIQKIPNIILIYNWISLLVSVLKHAGEQFPRIFLIIDNHGNILKDYHYFLFPLIMQLRQSDVSIIFNLAARDEGNLMMEAIGGENWRLHEIAPSTANPTEEEWHSRIFREKYHPSQIRDKNTFPEVSDGEMRFLQHLALFGFSFNSHYLNWVVNGHFDGAGEFVLNFFNQKTLRYLPFFFGFSEIAFSDINFYNHILNSIKPEFKNFILRDIEQFLQNSPDVYQKFILDDETDTLNLLQSISLLDNLLLYYFEMNDYKRRDEIYALIQKITSREKIPNDLKYKLNIAGRLPYYGQKIKSDFPELQAVYREIPPKYREERKYLLALLHFLAFEDKNIPRLDSLSTERNALMKKSEFLYFETELIRICGLMVAVQYKEAGRGLNELLILADKNNFYWYLPVTSYILALNYFKQRNWESAYRYCALAFQAGRAINDFWVMDKCIELMEKNKYYQENRSQLFNWRGLREATCAIPADYLKKADFRERLIQVIH